MVSGDIHTLAYDHGSGYTNPIGNFPIFQCAPLDKSSSCSNDQFYVDASFGSGQFCHFKVTEEGCLIFSGYQGSEVVMDLNTCDGKREKLDSLEAFDRANRATYRELTGSAYDSSVERALKPYGSDEITDLIREISAFQRSRQYKYKAVECPMLKPRQKSNLFLVVFGLVYGIGLLIVVTKKLCPKLIE
jgi:hypothetical protein